MSGQPPRHPTGTMVCSGARIASLTGAARAIDGSREILATVFPPIK